jgi:hypothetical protein
MEGTRPLTNQAHPQKHTKKHRKNKLKQKRVVKYILALQDLQTIKVQSKLQLFQLFSIRKPCSATPSGVSNIHMFPGGSYKPP